MAKGLAIVLQGRGQEFPFLLLTSPLFFDTLSTGDKMTRRMSNEEKVAHAIAKLLDSLTLNLDEVGKYLARFLPTTIYNRLMIIAESAEWEKENKDEQYDY